MVAPRFSMSAVRVNGRRSTYKVQGKNSLAMTWSTVVLLSSFFISMYLSFLPTRWNFYVGLDTHLAMLELFGREDYMHI